MRFSTILACVWSILCIIAIAYCLYQSIGTTSIQCRVTGYITVSNEVVCKNKQHNIEIIIQEDEINNPDVYYGKKLKLIFNRRDELEDIR